MFEIVHTMTDYYDGPRRGVADFGGEPHLYQSRWSDLNRNDDDTFLLMPIDADTFKLALEDWHIWRRYEIARCEGRASNEWHPALPEDRRRHEQLEILLRDRLVIDETIAFCAKGTFVLRPQETYERGTRLLLVEWTRVPCSDHADNRSFVDDE